MSKIQSSIDKLDLELRRGTLALAALSQLRTTRHGYSLIRKLTELGLEVEQGTLYPLLRRLDEQGLLDSEWNVEGSRPRKYYTISAEGADALECLSAAWRQLAQSMSALLDESPGGYDEPD
ncbi:MAG: PadR family transcriptional regulator [Xanthomonadales bacterium]|nr:PadR family transcriptional regulator [Xanthomonadales bacterium]